MLAEISVRKIRSVACGFIFSDYPKCLISRINEICVFFIKISQLRYFIEKNIHFIYNLLFCCNHTCYCVGMVAAMSAPRYVRSASRYKSISLMNIRVGKGGKIRNRYNQVPHLTQDTNWKVTNSQLDTRKREPRGQPFPSRWPQGTYKQTLTKA